MTTRGIPTKYAHQQFRSRLEATWAVFFDLVGWSWKYEPIDLTGYVPDFVLTFPKAPVLVEVKPAFSVAELETFTGKVEASGWDKEALIVGAGPIFEDHTHDFAPLGILAERGLDEDTGKNWWSWGRAILHECSDCKQTSVLHEYQQYFCRTNGCYSGGHWRGAPKRDVFEGLWRTAQNTVQWRAPV